jgi:hypothetical protein
MTAATPPLKEPKTSKKQEARVKFAGCERTKDAAAAWRFFILHWHWGLPEGSLPIYIYIYI